MDDLISRQDAIEAIEMLLEQSEDDENDKTWNNAIRGAVNAVKHHTKSAQPEDVIHITGRRKFVSKFDFDDDEPERKGEWIEMGTNPDGTHNIKCSKCGEGYKTRGHAMSFNTRKRYKYCPNCGAEMRGE